VRVETKTFFSLPFDLILNPLVENLNMLHVWKPGMRGKQPFDPVAVFKAIRMLYRLLFHDYRCT
ncbi:MAG: hypothetical protein ACTSUN_09300, partial [Promethearchaeota archaeon]